MKRTIVIFVLLLQSAAPLSAAENSAGKFREVCSEKSGVTPVVEGASGWLFLPAELRHIGAGKFWGEDAARASKTSKPEIADPLPAILDFKEQLDSVGIELILLPVPGKALVYPEALVGGDPEGPAGPRLDTFHQEFYNELRKHGVVVLDLLPEMLAKRNSPEGPIDCKQDTHWSGNGVVLAAQRIADLLGNKPWISDAPKIKTKAETKEVEITGDLTRMKSPGDPVKEKIALRFVGTEESGGSLPVAPDPNSPLVLLGDSHNLIFHAGDDMLATGAGLPDQLAHELGMPVDLVAVRGSGATPARVNLLRKARSSPDYLARKKAIVWCFSVREFTESSGWQKVPVVSKK